MHPKSTVYPQSIPHNEVENLHERDAQHLAPGGGQVDQDVGTTTEVGVPSEHSPRPRFHVLQDCKLLEDSPAGTIYAPIDTPQHYPALDFRPTLLKNVTLCVMIALNLGIIGCLVGLQHMQTLTRTHDLPSVNLYLAVSYGPSLIGTISSVLLNSTLQEVERIYPYVSMADRTSSDRGSQRPSESVSAQYFPVGVLWPLNRWGIPFSVLKLTGIWLVAVKTSLLQVFDSKESWIVLVHSQVANLLIAFYAIYVAFLSISIDPFYGSTKVPRLDWRRDLPGTPYNQKPIEGNLPIDAYLTLPSGAIIIGLCLYLIISGITKRTFTIDSHGQFKYALHDFNLTDLAKSGNVTEINYTFLPPGTHAVFGWNLVLRSIPIALMHNVYSWTARIDLQKRFAQPLLNMRFGPAAADTSLLLDYLTSQPLAVLSQAWSHGHWKVFYYAMSAMSAPLLKLTSVGILTLTQVKIGDDSIIIGEPSQAFIAATIVLLIVVLVSCALPCRFVKDPIFSQCDPHRKKENLSSDLRNRYDKYLLGALAHSDDERMGFEVSEMGRCGCVTRWIWYIDPQSGEPWHCHSSDAHRLQNFVDCSD
ncbi:hypothetical protein PG999_012214 [Apiospora kogelbergensis]|uniref:Uncharacterized protein n=1 Tax=Apiospora kogelbergensis TaxID=1337665 RepID=A0AAW0QGR5_9PEZI